MYFSTVRYRMLEQTSGVDEPGTIRWELCLLLLLAWVLIYLCIFKGVKSTGKVGGTQMDTKDSWKTLTSVCSWLQVVYFTALFPYVILIALLINNAQLPGALDGIKFFIVPQWERLLSLEVRKWRSARQIRAPMMVADSDWRWRTNVALCCRCGWTLQLRSLIPSALVLAL